MKSLEWVPTGNGYALHPRGNRATAKRIGVVYKDICSFAPSGQGWRWSICGCNQRDCGCRQRCHSGVCRYFTEAKAQLIAAHISILMGETS